jgi:oligoribonuclease NrnB/cAMP/cGMP phosphodiesterase (DHH superfamily)
MLILHHNDLDGYCSAAIIKYKYPIIAMYEINYGDDIPWDLIKDNIVFIVDFSLELENMKRALKESKKLIWIDHHIGAIRKLREIDHLILGFRDAEEIYSGCELTWKYIFPKDIFPKVVNLLGRYDVHDYSNPEVLPFQYAMQSKDTNPRENMNLWINLFNNQEESELDFLESENMIQCLIEEGKPIAQFVEKRNIDFVRKNKLCINFQGFKFLAVNSKLDNSNALEVYFDKDKYDSLMTFYRKPRGWSVNMYNGDFESKVDCAKIAEIYGGGGHANSAGFSCKKLPFEV